MMQGTILGSYSQDVQQLLAKHQQEQNAATISAPPRDVTQIERMDATARELASVVMRIQHRVSALRGVGETVASGSFVGPEVNLPVGTYIHSLPTALSFLNNLKENLAPLLEQLEEMV